MAERTLLQQRAGAHLLRRPGRAAGRRRRPDRGRPHRRGLRRTARRSTPASARVVDLDGATVLPGLGDAHVHISWPLDFVFDHDAVAAAPPAEHALDVAAVVRTFLESGYTLIIGAGVLQPRDDVLAKDAIDRGLIPGPRIVPSGPMIAEAGGLGADDGLMEVAADAARAARDRRPPVRRRGAGAEAVHLRRRRRARVPVRRRLHERRDAAGARSTRPTATARSSPSTPGARRASRWPPAPACGSSTTPASSTTRRSRELEARGDDVWVCPGLHYLYAVVERPRRAVGDHGRAGRRVRLPARSSTPRSKGCGKLRAAGVRIARRWRLRPPVDASRHLRRRAAALRRARRHDADRGDPHRDPQHGRRWPASTSARSAPARWPTCSSSTATRPTDITVLQQPERRRAVIKDGEFAYVNPAAYP